MRASFLDPSANECAAQWFVRRRTSRRSGTMDMLIILTIVQLYPCCDRNLAEINRSAEKNSVFSRNVYAIAANGNPRRREKRVASRDFKYVVDANRYLSSIRCMYIKNILVERIHSPRNTCFSDDVRPSHRLVAAHTRNS